MEVKPTYLGTMIALATAAFGLIAALAWNKFITDLIGFFLKPGSGIWAELVYAVIITVIAVIVIQNLAKLAERDIGPRTASRSETTASER
jgi:tetrahydromethanopterin S-methyltransferase subunit E